MDIKTSIDGAKALLVVDGKLTVQTSPDLSEALDKLPQSVTDIEIDMTDVTYVASAGLRVLVAAEKLVHARGGSLRLLHPCEEVMGVFEMTGLSEIFTIVQ